MQNLTPSEESQRWVLQLTIGLWDLMEGILSFLLLAWAIPLVRSMDRPGWLATPFATPYLGSFFAEYLRVLSQILMWSLLLIVPGFFRYLQLTFVNLIVLFSRDYRAGQIDALSFSERLMRGRVLQFAGVIGLTMGLQILCEFLPEMQADWHNLPTRVALALISAAINVWCFSWIFLKFEQAMNEFNASPMTTEEA